MHSVLQCSGEMSHPVREADAPWAAIEQQQAVGAEASGVGVVALGAHVALAADDVQGQHVEHGVHGGVHSLAVLLLHACLRQARLGLLRHPQVRSLQTPSVQDLSKHRHQQICSLGTPSTHESLVLCQAYPGLI